MKNITSFFGEFGRLVLRGKFLAFGMRYLFCKEQGFLNNPMVLFYIFTGKFPRIFHFRYSNYGIWLSGSKDDLTYGFCLKTYSNDLHKILAGIKNEMAFADIGANIGVFSLVAQKNKKIKEIYSFEPDPVTFSFLNRNTKFRFTRKLEIFNVAIGPFSKTSFLSQHTNHSGASSIIHDIQNGQKAKIVKMVGPEELNGLFFQSKLPLFIKIDVEGFELEVLQSLSKTDFFYRIESFFIEFDIHMGELELVSHFLSEHRFSEVLRMGTTEHWDALWQRDTTNCP